MDGVYFLKSSVGLTSRERISRFETPEREMNALSE
jgi:hypothetical protein